MDFLKYYYYIYKLIINDYHKFVKKYNKEFSLVGISKLTKPKLKKKIEDVLSEQRTEIKDEWRKLHPREYGQAPAPKKEAPKKTAPKKTEPQKTKSKKNEYDRMFAYMTGMSIKSVKFTEKQLETALKNIDKNLSGDQKKEWIRVYNDKRRVGFKPKDDRKKVIEAIEPKTDFEKTLKEKLQEREKAFDKDKFKKAIEPKSNEKKQMGELGNDMYDFMLSKLPNYKGKRRVKKKKYTIEELKEHYRYLTNNFSKNNFIISLWIDKYEDFLKFQKRNK